MPIYEYVCNVCGHEFEEWQKISDAPANKCPSCGKRSVERLVSLSAFHLKGSGWYVTDYGGKNRSSSDSESKSSSNTSNSDTASKSEKKEGGTSKPSQESK